MLQLLQHFKLIIDHALIASDVFLQNDLDRDLFSIGGFRLANNAVCACTQRPPELVESPRAKVSEG